MFKSAPPVAMALCFSIITFLLQHTDCPSPSPPLNLQTSSTHDFPFVFGLTPIAFPAHYLQPRSQQLKLELKNTVVRYRGQDSAVRKTATLVVPNCPLHCVHIFFVVLGVKRNWRSSLIYIVIFLRILFTDCNKNEIIVDLYVCYGCCPQHVSQWETAINKWQQKGINPSICTHVLTYCPLAA
jgi:hypothetical protein